jgi:hypothetical protein
MNALLVTVRMTGGAWLARCHKGVASCTSDAYTAAARAAGKVLGVVESRVVLKPVDPTSQHSYWALPITVPESERVGYKTASQILTDAAAARDRRYTSGPGSYGDRLD